MNDTNTDVMIYTKTTLSETQFSVVASEVKTIAGVLQFEQIKHKPRFIKVVYSATRTRALTILNKITRLGFNASLVGI